MTTTEPLAALPDDLGSLAALAEGQLHYLGKRYLARLVYERRIASYRVGGRVLISASEVEALVARGRREAWTG